jgi:hypothetical protein
MLESVMPLLLIAAMIAFGGFTGWMAVDTLIKHVKLWRSASRSKTWPGTEGRIVQAILVPGGGPRRSPRPGVTYTYRVNDIEYTGDRINFDDLRNYFHTEVEEVLKRYQPNSPVPVYYDPDQPAASTLEQTARGLDMGLLIIPIALLGVSALCLCASVFGLMDLLQK